MGAVASMIGVVVAKALYTLFQKPPAAPKPDTTPESRADVQRRCGIDCVKHYNIAIIGPRGVGKSSTINAIVGDKVAAVGAGETTMTMARYQGEGNLKMWDVPGCGTKNFPVDTYADKFGLIGFDAIVVLYNDAIPEYLPAFLKHFKAQGLPYCVVRSKCDQAVDALIDDEDLSDRGAHTKIRAIAAGEQRGLQGDGVREGLCVSMKKFGKGVASFDEGEVLTWIHQKVQLRFPRAG